jgi:hypothetical protein
MPHEQNRDPSNQANTAITQRRTPTPGRPTPGPRRLAPVGALSGRARLGHRARGLQRGRRGLGLLPHEHARSRTYRWNEDGLGGICDAQQHLCLALALWNGRDPFLKERAFGLTGKQGNRGEDVKEAYFYRDATPSHSWLRFLYKYPQRPFLTSSCWPRTPAAAATTRRIS